MDHAGASNPLRKKSLVRLAPGWLNYNNMPTCGLIPALGVVLPLLTILFSRHEKGALAFVFSSLTWPVSF